MLVPTPLKSSTIEDDLALEWLLCLASTVEASKRLRLTEVSEAPRHEEFRTTDTETPLRRRARRQSILPGE